MVGDPWRQFVVPARNERADANPFLFPRMPSFQQWTLAERLAVGDTGVQVFRRACSCLPLIAVCGSTRVSACRRMSLLCQFCGD